MAKLQMKPSPLSGAIGAVASGGLVLFGLTMFDEFGSGPSGVFGQGFLMVWLVLALAGFVASLMYAVGGGAPTEVGEIIVRSKEGTLDIEARLLQLDQLRDKGLVAPAEYEAKRREILGQL